MRLLRYAMALTAVVALILPAAAVAQTDTYTCSWNDPASTILGSYGNVVNPTNVTDFYNSPTHALRVTEYPHYGTPQAYIGFVDGLTDGDVVTASFYGWDDTPSASPSLRIWAHYVADGDIDNYQGSTGEGSGYTDGSGWCLVEHSWTFDSDGGNRDGLVIEARLYSTPSTCDTCATDYWIDSLEITAPVTATVYMPSYDGQATPVEATTWGRIKNQY